MDEKDWKYIKKHYLSIHKPVQKIGKKRRTRFKLKDRIRDHHDCNLYESKCLPFAAKHNLCRVCYEGCENYIQPHPKEALIIAELLENFFENMRLDAYYESVKES